MRNARVTGSAIALLAVLAPAFAAVPSATAAGSGSVPVVPAPVSAASGSGNFLLSAKTPIKGQAGTENARTQLRASLKAVAKLKLARSRGSHAITLRLVPGMGTEQYALRVKRSGAVIEASTDQGLFRGSQSLVQLAAASPRAGSGALIKAVSIQDSPRYSYRGVMLDVARQFFGVSAVKRLIDRMALLKFNTLHLHLTDDQGWRLEIKGRPELTAIGAQSAAGGGPGGYYTQAQYSELVRYAADRYITVVPEIDLPGHTNAAMASDASLTCGGVAPAPYTGRAILRTSVCVRNEATYSFIRDVLSQVAALTPGPYLHRGGDEVRGLSDSDWSYFEGRLAKIIASTGKEPISWAPGPPSRDLAQNWIQQGSGRSAILASSARATVLSPPERTYLDMKPAAGSKHGVTWAGVVSAKKAYGWNPATYPTVAGGDALAGVEAPLWTEYVSNEAAADQLLFPRLASVAEVGWSAQSTRSWKQFRKRLGHQATAFDNLGIRFHRDRAIPWR